MTIYLKLLPYVNVVFLAALMAIHTQPAVWWDDLKARRASRIIGCFCVLPGVLTLFGILRSVLLSRLLSGTTLGSTGWSLMLSVIGLPIVCDIVFLIPGVLIFLMKRSALPAFAALTAWIVFYWVYRNLQPAAHSLTPTLVVLFLLSTTVELLICFFLYRMHQWGYFEKV